MAYALSKGGELGSSPLENASDYVYWNSLNKLEASSCAIQE